MIKHPQLAPGFQSAVVPDEEEAIVLLSEHETRLLRGRLYRTVVPRLDGRHTVPELIEQLQGQVPAPEVYYAVMRLAEQGYVVDAEAPVSGDGAAYWHVQHVDAAIASERLRTSPVTLTACGAVSLAPLQAALTALSIPLHDEGVLDVVVTDDYLHPHLETVNNRLLAAGRPWLLLKPVGTELWLGPLFRPGQTGCWVCLAQRLRNNRPVQTWLRNRSEDAVQLSIHQAALASSTQTAVHLAVTAIAQWLATGEHAALEGQILTLALPTLQMRQHVLVRRPQCTVCGDPVRCTEPLKPLVLPPPPQSVYHGRWTSAYIPSTNLGTLWSPRQSDYRGGAGVVANIRCRRYGGEYLCCPECLSAGGYSGRGALGLTPDQQRQGQER